MLRLLKSSEKKLNKFKLITLLQTFTALEVKRFSRFLQSPYHNNKKLLVTLFDQLRSYYPSFEAPKFNRLQIWKNIFGAKSFNAKIFKKICFELNTLAETFIVIEQVKNNQRTKDKLLIEALSPRNFERFEKETKSLISKIKEKKELAEQDDFLDVHLLQRNLWYHFEKEKHQTSNIELEEHYYALYVYTAFEKIKTVSEIETRKKYLNITNTLLPLDLKNSIGKEIIETNIALTLRHQFKEFVHNPNLLTYFDLKNRLLIMNELPDKNMLRDGIMHLNNFLVREDTKGGLSQEKESFELYKWAAEQGIFIVEKSIHEVIMVNTIIFALKNQQIAWAKNYLVEHEPYLKIKNKEMVIPYLKAIIQYQEKDFERVIQLLATVQPGKMMQYFFLIKSILTRALFELILDGREDYLGVFTAQLDSFETGLYRNRKFSKSRITSYLNFLKIFRRLYQLFLLPEQKAFNQLEKDLAIMSPIIGKPWFKEKIAILRNKLKLK